ncbi:hypothetical protein [Salinispora arenicola]|uniref:hypothetical protein n=1 Tax=Salinispora arenicola TaxID=168697 RepID=UPI000379AE5E|nr:hypothetical protein [Salinispora arenicola]
MAAEHRGRQELPSLDTLAARLEYLFETIRPSRDEVGGQDHGRRYTNKEIADKINRLHPETGVSISAAYVGELRRGVASDPRTSHVRALARAFGVHSSFFVDDATADRVKEQLKLLSELRRMGVEQVALRQVLAETGLSSADSQLVEQMVARLQGLGGSQQDDQP